MCVCMGGGPFHSHILLSSATLSATSRLLLSSPPVTRDAFSLLHVSLSLPSSSHTSLHPLIPPSLPSSLPAHVTCLSLRPLSQVTRLFILSSLLCLSFPSLLHSVPSLLSPLLLRPSSSLSSFKDRHVSVKTLVPLLSGARVGRCRGRGALLHREINLAIRPPPPPLPGPSVRVPF